MIKKGVYAAGISVINPDLSLNIEETINHAEKIIDKGLHGVFFFGSTGQSQLISISEKKELISKISTNKNRKNFFIGTGCNSIADNIEIIKYSLAYEFNTFLIMPPAYYKNNSDEGVFRFYESIIDSNSKVKIILYNFEKLSGYKFSIKIIKDLKKRFPKNIIGCKDSTYNLYENLKIDNFMMFPGTESKLLKGLEMGCAGCISAVTNVTHSLSRKVYDDFENKKKQTVNQKLVNVRSVFDNYNLISAIHSYLSLEDKKFLELLPPLKTLGKKDLKTLIDKLEKENFFKGSAA